MFRIFLPLILLLSAFSCDSLSSYNNAKEAKQMFLLGYLSGYISDTGPRCAFNDSCDSATGGANPYICYNLVAGDDSAHCFTTESACQKVCPDRLYDTEND